jgi:hypothetical protein
VPLSNSKLIAILEHLLKIGIGKLQDPAPAAEQFGNCPAVEGGMFTFIIFVVKKNEYIKR